MLNKIIAAITTLLTVFLAGSKSGKRGQTIEMQEKTIELLTKNDAINKKANTLDFANSSKLLLKKRKASSKK
jgi:hypothetical protein